MIAIEWKDWNAPRDSVTSQVIPRTGVLLHVGIAKVKGETEPRNAAWIIVKKMDHDGGIGKDGEKIVLAVELTRITITGVHIPFEPYEGAN